MKKPDASATPGPDHGGSKAGRILAVGGGKGGVGKSVASIVLASALSRRGEKVVLVDLDLGAANLHTYLGLHGDAPGIADFLMKRVSSLDELLMDTPLPGVRLISGARYYSGMANLTYQAKQKIIRHLKNLDADVVILDLGAGVHFDTIDFFAISHPSLLVLAPEPGSVLNAYSFLKECVFRHLTGIFGKHPDIGPEIRRAQIEGGDETSFSLESFRATIRKIDESVMPIVDEAVRMLRPAIIMNRVTDLVSAVYADNLQKLVLHRLALRVRYLGNLPGVQGLSEQLVGLPAFLASPGGAKIMSAADELLADLEKNFPPEWPAEPETAAGANAGTPREDFSEDELQTLSLLLDSLGDAAFRKTGRKTSQNVGQNIGRNAWKLRLYYRPVEVVRFLIGNGLSHPVFYA
jgi:flagellar biosynthesis protein FlhG